MELEWGYPGPFKGDGGRLNMTIDEDFAFAHECEGVVGERCKVA